MSAVGAESPSPERTRTRLGKRRLTRLVPSGGALAAGRYTSGNAY